MSIWAVSATSLTSPGESPRRMGRSTPVGCAHLGGLLARLGVSIGTTGASVSVGPRPPSPEAQAAESVLHRLLDLPKTLHERDEVPTLVVFDEFQDLLVARQDLDGVVRSRIQYHGDAAAYVYAGSEPSMMRELFDRRERPLFGQADPLALGPLPLDDLLADLADRFSREALDPGDALGELAVFAGGHPQRVMMLCHLLAEQLQDGRPGTADAIGRRGRDRAHPGGPRGLVESASAVREGRAGRRRRWRRPR
jgi:hypothetical protein